jgi:Group II intron, maturase-specific domain
MDYRIGRLNRLITGWVAYFRLAQRVSVLGKLDGWLRRRLRQVRWKEWKTTAAKRHNLRIRGISESEARKWAGVSRRYWRVAGSQILQVSRLLLEPPWPEDPEPDLAASQPSGLTNRRMRTRMSGGVRGGGATPPPTRFQ